PTPDRPARAVRAAATSSPRYPTAPRRPASSAVRSLLGALAHGGGRRVPRPVRGTVHGLCPAPASHRVNRGGHHDGRVARVGGPPPGRVDQRRRQRIAGSVVRAKPSDVYSGSPSGDALRSIFVTPRPANQAISAAIQAR